MRATKQRRVCVTPPWRHVGATASAHQQQERSLPSVGVIVMDETKEYRVQPCTLHRRYKRFLGDVTFDSEEACTVVHVPNTGPMTGLLDHMPSQAMVSASSNPKRKYRYTLEWLKDGHGTWVGVHSAKANAMVATLLDAQVLKDVLPIPYTRYTREVKIPSSSSLNPTSRIDFELVDDASGKTCLVEVKSVTMVAEDGESRVAVFPDTKSERAQKHVKELIRVVEEQKKEAAMIFVIQRGDCSSFSPCFEKDPEYFHLVCRAAAAGVRIVPVVVDLVDPSRSIVKYTGMIPYRPCHPKKSPDK